MSCLLWACQLSTPNNKEDLLLSASLDSIIHHSDSINPIIDSLLQNVRSASNNTAKIDALNELPEPFFSVDSRKAYLIANETFNLSAQQDYVYGKGVANIKIAIYRFMTGQVDTALFFVKASLKEANISQNKRLAANCYAVLGNIHLKIGSLDSAMFFTNQALSLAKQTHFIKYIIYANAVKGELFYYQEMIDSSLYYKEQNLLLAEKYKDLRHLGHENRFLGDYYCIKNDYPKALSYLKKALFYAEQNYDRRLIASCEVTLAMIYERIGNNEKALESYKRGLENALKTKDKHIEYTCYYGLTILYYNANNANKFPPYLDKSLSLAKSLKRTDHLSSLYVLAANRAYYQANYPLSYRFLDSAYHTNGDIPTLPEYYILSGKLSLKEGKTKQAQDSLLKGLNIAITRKRFEPQQEMSRLLYELYKNEKNYEKALYYFTILKSASDSLTNAAKIKEVTAAEYSLKEQTLKLEQVQKENALRFVNQQNLHQKRYWQYGTLFIAFIFLALFCVFYLYFRQNKLKYEKLQLLNEQKRLILEQKMRQLQMNPHFIYNALDSIQAYMLNNQAQLAADYLSHFAKLMRMILEHSRQEYIELAEEINALDAYLYLQQLIADKTFTYSIAVDAEIDVENTHIPPLLLQPIVENAVKHGLKYRERKGEIKIDIRLLEGFLVIDIKDNGFGFSKRTTINENIQKKHNSLSTLITNERIALLNENKVKKTSIHIQELTDEMQHIIGTLVQFKIAVD